MTLGSSFLRPLGRLDAVKLFLRDKSLSWRRQLYTAGKQTANKPSGPPVNTQPSSTRKEKQNRKRLGAFCEEPRCSSRFVLGRRQTSDGGAGCSTAACKQRERCISTLAYKLKTRRCLNHMDVPPQKLFFFGFGYLKDQHLFFHCQVFKEPICFFAVHLLKSLGFFFVLKSQIPFSGAAWSKSIHPSTFY